MRQRKPDRAKQTATPSSPRPNPTINTPSLGIATPQGDWSELGRRVLAEALRRSMCELRRRNGCGAGQSGFRGRTEGLS